jgi:uncharacterized protein YraI
LHAGPFIAIILRIANPESPMPRRVKLILFAAMCCVLSSNALAQLDATRRATIVRAGPDSVFPQVTRLPAASNVHIFGCTANRLWCDILSGRTRGWVRLSDLSQSSRLVSAETVTFSVADYWDAHYRTRAWYSSRDRWLGWGQPGFVPPTGNR